MEVGQGPNWGCSAKEKKTIYLTFTNNKTNNSIFMALYAVRTETEYCTLSLCVDSVPYFTAIEL
jgi:hypothetical protein